MAAESSTLRAVHRWEPLHPLLEVHEPNSTMTLSRMEDYVSGFPNRDRESGECYSGVSLLLDVVFIGFSFLRVVDFIRLLGFVFVIACLV